LELDQSKFDSFRQFVNFITEFPSLELLSLTRGEWDEDFGSPSSQVAQNFIPANLTSLKASVYSPCKRELVEWLLRCQPMPAISTLDFHDVTVNEAPAISRLMQTLGPTLQHLCLGFDINHETDDLRQTFDLAPNTELRSICLNSCGLISPSIPNFATCFPSILSTTASHAVEEITICLEHPTLESLELREWEVMVSLFDAPQFSGLRRILFRIFGLTGMDERALEMLIKERLAECTSRGILSVETGNSRSLVLTAM